MRGRFGAAARHAKYRFWRRSGHGFEITAVGSRIVNSLIDELTAGGDNADIDFDTTGTTAGIDRFCNGDIDMVTATRPK